MSATEHRVAAIAGFAFGNKLSAHIFEPICGKQTAVKHLDTVRGGWFWLKYVVYS